MWEWQMWLFNPGNPTRGSVLLREFDPQPPVIMDQVSLPTALRLEVPPDFALASVFPESIGTRYLVRDRPFGDLFGDWVLGSVNAFSYGEIAGSGERVFRLYAVNPSAVVISNDLTIDNVLHDTLAATVDDLLAWIEADTGEMPTEVSRREIDLLGFIGVWELVFTLPGGLGPHTVEQIIIATDPDTSTNKTVRLDANSGSLARWTAGWLKMALNARVPMLQFADLALFSPESTLSRHDIMREMVLTGYELLLDESGEVTRGEPLGEATLTPAWP